MLPTCAKVSQENQSRQPHWTEHLRLKILPVIQGIAYPPQAF